MSKKVKCEWQFYRADGFVDGVERGSSPAQQVDRSFWPDGCGNRIVEEKKRYECKLSEMDENVSDDVKVELEKVWN